MPTYKLTDNLSLYISSNERAYLSDEQTTLSLGDIDEFVEALKSLGILTNNK